MKSKEQVLEVRRARLRVRGVPEKFVEALANWQLEPFPVIGVGLFGLWYIGLVISVVASLFGVFDGVYALVYAGEVGESDLFGSRVFFGAALVGLGFSALMLPPLAERLLSRLKAPEALTRARRSDVVESLLEKGETGDRRLTPARVKAFGELETAEAYIDALAPAPKPHGPFYRVDLIFVVTLVMLGLARFDYWNLHGTRIDFSRPWGRQGYDLSQAKRVDVGCSRGYSEMGKGTAMLDYSVAFDGDSANLAVRHDVVNHLTFQFDGLDRVMRVDDYFRARGMPVHRYADLDASARECVADLMAYTRPEVHRQLESLYWKDR